MTSQFSPKVSEVLAFSREEAARLASRSVGPEHLLLGLLRMKESPVIDMFRRLNLNIQSMKTELEQRVREDELSIPIHTSDLVLNEKASNILKLAVLEARIQRMTKVNEQHLLLAILHDQVNNGAKEILEFNNMNYEDALALLHAPQQTATDGIGKLLRQRMLFSCPMRTRKNMREKAPLQTASQEAALPPQPQRNNNPRHLYSTTSAQT